MKKTIHLFTFILLLSFSSAIASTIYVNTSVSGGSNNGSSWTDAFTSLQSALDAVVSGDEIWVAKGTYFPSEETDGSTDTQRKYSFQMVDGVAIYGGFAGTETAVTQRTDYNYGSTNETILSGDFNEDDVITGSGSTLSISGNTENCYHLFYHPSGYTLSNTSILDGFTLSGAYSESTSGTSHYNDGAAIQNREGQSPTINNCYFIGNEVSDNGGAMMNANSSNAIITNCTFTKNMSGVGMEGSGGAIYNYGSAPQITNCLFAGNRVGGGTNDLGGAIYNNEVSNPVITNCTIVENYAKSGGGVYNNNDSDPTITNCIVWGNTINGGTGIQIRNFDRSNLTISYCDIEGGIAGGITSADTPTDNGGNIDSDPAFVGSSVNSSHPYSIIGTSPCVDVGNDASNSETYDTRGSGYGRKLSKADGSTGTIDIGAYEYKFNDDVEYRIIYVDTDAAGNNDGTNWTNAYTSFQSALNAASSGDIIWVANGTYNPSQDTDGTTCTEKEFTFQMKNGVAIYGGFAGTETALNERVNYGAGEANETMLSGDLNGDDVVTGNGSSLSITNNSENCYQVFLNPTFLDNTAVLDGFTITGGNADNIDEEYYRGGGMYNGNSSPSISNCTFSGNTAIDGGGMYNSNSSPSISNCSFSGNTAIDGGGMYNGSTSSPSISDCTFSGNSASSYGGGMYTNSSSPSINNSAFSGNSANTSGGGMYNKSASPSIINCTFSSNSASYGGGMFNYDSSSPIIKNSILWANTATNSGNDVYNNSSTPTFSYCNIESSGGSSSWDTGFGTDGGDNIDSDPLFVGSGDHPYLIYGVSPCVDAGDNSANSEEFDIRGSNYGRKLSKTDGSAGTIDIGAYEYKINIDPYEKEALYVNLLAEGANNGFSWVNAFTSLQSALDAASTGDTIWVAKGTYNPSKEQDGTVDESRKFTFQMKNGIAIYGGFAGTETAFNERVNYGTGEINETILSGDFNNDDVVTGSGSTLSISNNSENCYHVFYHPSETNLDGTAVLDGFTITGGNADGSSNYSYGGGMFNSISSPSITNCTFSSNSASNAGGMYNESSSPSIINSTISGNSAGLGGGIYDNSSSSSSILNCTFSGNSATTNSRYGGGGMFIGYSTTSLINCIFVGNSGNNGGSVYNFNSSPSITNCSFSSNSVTSSGGAISNMLSSPIIKNCILWGNTAGSSNEVYNDDSTPTFSYCNIEGGIAGISENSGSSTTDGGGNINSDPLFIGSGDHPYAITSESPCADTGNDSYCSETTDKKGDGRKLLKTDGNSTGTIDIGAYEYSTENPLPVELVSFTASIVENSIILNWETATEVENYGFEVERAIYNEQLSINDWETLGFVQGSGNSNSPKSYEFIDESPLGDSSEYRLKQIDTDGKYSYYSETAKVVFGVTDVNDENLLIEFSLAQNYPNPFNPSTVINYSLSKASDVHLIIYNMLGQEVATLVNTKQEAGIFSIEFNASNLTSGIYFYSIKAGEFVSVRKMLLMK